MLGNLLIALILIFANAVFAAAEKAIASIIGGVHSFDEEDGRGTRMLERLNNDEDRFLATARIGKSFAALFAGAFAASALWEPSADFILRLAPSLDPGAAIVIAAAVTLAISAYLLTTLGDMAPRALAARYPRSFARPLVNLVYFVSVIARPFAILAGFSERSILRLPRSDSSEAGNEMTEKRIKKLLEESEESGNIDEAEKEMINNIFEFDTLSVGDILAHRTDIIALPIDAPKDEIIRVFTTERFSRIPIYEENIDNIIGILHVRDFLNYIILPENYNKESVDLREIIRTPYYVPISKKSDELFREMQKSKIHFAVVVDEYGGTAGIVTMENIIEEIMGSILDEYDEEERPEIEEIEPNTFIINGAADLEEVSERLGVKLPSEDYDTIGGFAIGQIGRVPDEGDEPEFEFEGLAFKVLKVEDKRVAYMIATRV